MVVTAAAVDATQRSARSAASFVMQRRPSSRRTRPLQRSRRGHLRAPRLQPELQFGDTHRDWNTLRMIIAASRRSVVYNRNVYIELNGKQRAGLTALSTFYSDKYY